METSRRGFIGRLLALATVPDLARALPATPAPTTVVATLPALRAVGSQVTSTAHLAGALKRIYSQEYFQEAFNQNSPLLFDLEE